MVNFLLSVVMLACFCFSLAQPALALTEAQVVDRLATIPVFVITDRDGIPLVGTNNNEKEERVLPFFLDPKEAEATIQTIQNKELEAQVVARSMEDMYNFVQSNQDKQLTYQIVPSASSLKAAAELAGGNENQLPNVPVFFAVDKQDTNEGLLTLSRGENLFIPFFFEKEELDRLIADLNQSDNTTKTQVKTISFFQVLNSMIDSEENKASGDVEKFAFFPGQNSLLWIKDNSPAPPRDQP